MALNVEAVSQWLLLINFFRISQKKGLNVKEKVIFASLPYVYVHTCMGMQTTKLLWSNVCRSVHIKFFTF